jgi:ATP/maltotriose-dependent transcriptional regulator MalT
MTVGLPTSEGFALLEAGRWQEARIAFEAGLGATAPPAALVGLSDALFFLGEVGDSVQYRERAYASFRRAGNIPDAVDCAVWLCLVFAMSLGNQVAARGWLARGESLMSDSDQEVLHAWLKYCRAILTSETGRSHALLTQALSSARRLAEVDLELCALGELGVVLTKAGDIESGLHCVDEAMAGALGGERRTFYTVVMTSCSMLTVCDLTGDLNRARQWSRAADDLMRRYGCPYLYAECRIVYGRVLVLTGRWTEAEGHLEKAATCTRKVFPGMHIRTLASLADLRRRQGRLEEAQTLIESIGAPVEASLTAAALSLRSGEPQAAGALVERWLRAEADPVLPPIHAGGRGLSIEMASALCLLVQSKIASGDVAGAENAVARLDELASASRTDFACAGAALGRARLAATRAAQDVAVRRYEEAMNLFTQLEMPLEAALTRLELAHTLRAEQPNLAGREARTALSALERIGARADADIAAAVLRSWGEQGRAVPRTSSLLTRRERDVLQLLVSGLSNQEIAERLYISRRTAAHHVSNLLAKLGVRNRAEAVGYATRNAVLLDSSTSKPVRQSDGGMSAGAA